MTRSTRSLGIGIAFALDSPKLFKPFFDGPSWNVWRGVLKATFGEALSKTERTALRKVAERDPPSRAVRELVCIAGRGAGKDSIASAVATFKAATFDPRGVLRPGERGVVMCLAVDRDQAKIVYGYIAAMFEHIPALAAMVTKVGADHIELSNGVVIEVHTSNFRSVRGRSIICCIMDEVAFWKDERSASPDLEVHGAVTPGLARVPGSLLVLISTAHKRGGLLFERWREHYGKACDVLVVKGTTVDFNPKFDQKIIDDALASDPDLYSAEYLSEWRSDVEGFVRRETAEACIIAGRYELPPVAGVVYVAFVDPSGGTTDAMTLAICHREGDRVIHDCIREVRSPFNPDKVAKQFAELLRS